MHAPTAGSGTFMNLGATVEGANGGQTSFTATCSADAVTLVATGGTKGGAGGQIAFYDKADGGTCTIQLDGTGTLNISDSHQESLTINELICSGGVITTSLGEYTIRLQTHSLQMQASPLMFNFVAGDGFEPERPFAIFATKNLPDYSTDHLKGNSLHDLSPEFRIEGDMLLVRFMEQS